MASRDLEPLPAPDELVEIAVLRQVADSTEPLVVPNVEDHPLVTQRPAGAANAVRGFAAVPIASTRDYARAALCVIDSKPLTISAVDIDALAAFGRHVGLELDRVSAIAPERKATIEMTDDVEALQHLASTDPLTGIANRRGGEKHITNEISRARGGNVLSSCILIDIDRFKAVNDTFGHQAGPTAARHQRPDPAHRPRLRHPGAMGRGRVPARAAWGGAGPGPGAGRPAAGGCGSADTHGIGPVTVSAGAAEFENVTTRVGSQDGRPAVVSGEGIGKKHGGVIEGLGGSPHRSDRLSNRRVFREISRKRDPVALVITSAVLFFALAALSLVSRTAQVLAAQRFHLARWHFSPGRPFNRCPRCKPREFVGCDVHAAGSHGGRASLRGPLPRVYQSSRVQPDIAAAGRFGAVRIAGERSL